MTNIFHHIFGFFFFSAECLQLQSEPFRSCVTIPLHAIHVSAALLAAPEALPLHRGSLGCTAGDVSG